MCLSRLGLHPYSFNWDKLFLFISASFTVSLFQLWSPLEQESISSFLFDERQYYVAIQNTKVNPPRPEVYQGINSGFRDHLLTWKDGNRRGTGSINHPLSGFLPTECRGQFKSTFDMPQMGLAVKMQS